MVIHTAIGVVGNLWSVMAETFRFTMDTPLLIGDTAVKSVASGSAPINECIGS